MRRLRWSEEMKAARFYVTVQSSEAPNGGH